MSPEVTFANLSKVQGLRDIPGPSATDPWSKKDVRSWCGAAGFYRCYIPCFGDLVRPLHALTRDDVKPNNNIGVNQYWTQRLPEHDPRYETHNITLSGDIRPATYDTDRNRREYTCQEGFEQSKAELCLVRACPALALGLGSPARAHSDGLGTVRALRKPPPRRNPLPPARRKVPPKVLRALPERPAGAESPEEVPCSRV
eukprot:COSAG01_NODE_25671_length_737_cov_1.442006_1_plen_199_part_01